MRIEMLTSARELETVRGEWNALARRRRTPFLTVEWFVAWSAAFADRPLVLLLREPAGALAGGAVLQRRRGTVCSAGNVHTGDWDVLARDEAARRQVWQHVAALGAQHGRFSALLDAPDVAGVAREVLAAAGYGITVNEDVASPARDLPPTYEELLASVSRSLRQQVRRRQRGLHREGRLVFRTTRGGERLATDLEAFFRLEASGWKGRAGTARRSPVTRERFGSTVASPRPQRTLGCCACGCSSSTAS